MDLDERIMDKIIADVKEIIAEPDGTLRFIFYSPYFDETYEDSELESKDKIIEELEAEIERLRCVTDKKDATIKLLEEKLAGGIND